MEASHGICGGEKGGRIMRSVEKQKKKGFPFFWIFYLLFVITLIVFWICVAEYVKKGLVLYEENQPDAQMEKVMDELRSTGLEQYMTVGGEISRFETAENYSGEFRERTGGKILFCTKAKGFQDAAAPKYELYADGELIGYVTLKELSSKPFMGILSLSEWSVGSVEILAAEAEESLTVTVPDAYQVWINGQQADERELMEGSDVAQEFVYAAEYVEVPKLLTYETKGLLQKPSVRILDQNGNEVAFEESCQGHETKITVGSMQESEMPTDLSTMVLENAERYTNYFSVDLPGCRNSVEPIRDMFPQDSYYLQLADTYRREDMWMYSDHDAPVFMNESVSHYVRYTEVFFSCEVYFDKKMKLKKTGRDKIDTTHFRLYYGLLDGSWKILDIQTLLDES